MTPKQLDEKIKRTLSAIHRLEHRIEWIYNKIEYRRRRIRELCKLRGEALTMKLPIE